MQKTTHKLIIALILSLFPALALAEVGVLGAYWRADEPFPQFRQFWHEGWEMPDEGGEAPPGFEELGQTLGGSVHLFLRNTGSQPVGVKDILLEGISLNASLVDAGHGKVRKFHSIYFAKMPEATRARLIAAGEPVWRKADPASIPSGGTGEVVIRMRQKPEAATVKVGLKCTGGDVEATIRVQPHLPRLAGISFGPDLKTVYLYFRHPQADQKPTRILIDGQDVTARAQIGTDPRLPITPVVVQLDKPLETTSFHVFQGVFADGTQASAGQRASADEFLYGMWGGMPGKDGDLTAARRYVLELTNHNINVQMPQLGSAAVTAYFKSEAGQKDCAKRGLRHVLSAPGKWGIKEPFLYFVHDEPDCGDYRIKGLPEKKKVGGLAQWCVQHTHELRESDPGHLQFLNLDSTYKPHNWYTYGQIADIFSIDPYYQVRLRKSYEKHPERLALYCKATYIYAISSVAESACEPRPLNVILYSCNHIDGKTGQRFRFPTPESKRFEVYYALAAGAKGLSYWWFTPAKPGKGAGSSYGVGAAITDNDPGAKALWREIGLLGAEVRTAGPVLLKSCPADLPVEASEGLWVRPLLAGLDTVVLIAVNEQYATDRVGTTVVPLENASVKLDLPAWLQAGQAFEINHQGIQDLTGDLAQGTLSLDLGQVDQTRLIVVTADKSLRNELAKTYRSQFAAKARRLESERIPTADRKGNR